MDSWTVWMKRLILIKGTIIDGISERQGKFQNKPKLKKKSLKALNITR